MNVALQGIGIGALLIGFIGQWLAPRSPLGWLIGLVSAGLWVVPLTDGEQWAGVASCTVSMTICARNYWTAQSAFRSSDDALTSEPETLPLVVAGRD